MKKKYILIAVGLLVVGYIALRIWAKYYIEKHRPMSYQEAGTDFTKKFNNERIKKGLPPIPGTWYNVNPLYYKVQTWENPDTIPPRHAEKTVVAGLKAQIESESDRYELRKKDGISYQVVIEYDYLDSSFICTLRNTREPEANGIRWRGDVLDTLTYKEAIDTLKFYGLSRD